MKVSKIYSFKICFAVCSVFTLMVLPPLATADPITFDLTPGGDFGPEGNIGVSSSATIDGLTLTLTAAFKIPRVSGDPYYDAGWPDGSILISEYGAGVQSDTGGGSEGISGKGGNRDEAIIMTFSDPISTATVYFSDFDVVGKKPEIPSIYVGNPLSDGTLPSLDSATIMANVVLHPTGSISGIDFDVYSLDFSDPDLVWSGGMPSSFNQIAFRNGIYDDDGEEYYITFFDGVFDSTVYGHAPEPGTCILLGSGILAIAGTRFWKKHGKK